MFVKYVPSHGLIYYKFQYVTRTYQTILIMILYNKVQMDMDILKLDIKNCVLTSAQSNLFCSH